MSRNEWVTPRCGPHYRNKDIQHKMMADSIRPRNRQGEADSQPDRAGQHPAAPSGRK